MKYNNLIILFFKFIVVLYCFYLVWFDGFFNVNNVNKNSFSFKGIKFLLFKIN